LIGDLATILVAVAIGIVFISSKSSSAVVAPVAATNDEAVLARLWTGIGVPSRLKKVRTVTLTGTVVGVKPHYVSDGDMVFALKPDPPNDTLVNAKNKAESKMGGGLWMEAICQKANTSKEPWHVGDCARGGPFPKFPMPKLGDRLRVTGTYAIDTREGGHAEVHGISRMQKI